MKSAEEILKEVDRKIEYYEEREQMFPTYNPEYNRIRGALKSLRSLKKFIEKE